MLTSPPIDVARPQSSLVESHRLGLLEAPAKELRALVGLCIVAAASTAGCLPAALASGCAIVCGALSARGKRSPDWRHIAANIPLDAQAADGLLSAVGLDSPARPFLVAVSNLLRLPIIAAPVAAPPAAPALSLRADVAEPQSTGTEGRVVGSALKTPGDEDRIDVGPASSDQDASGVTIVGRLRSAQYARWSEKLGLVHWDAIFPDDLADITRRLVARLTSDGMEAKRHCALALCSLLTGCSDHHALNLALAPCGDIWLEIDAGSIFWSFDAYRQTVRPDEPSDRTACVNSRHRPPTFHQATLSVAPSR